MHLDSGPNEFHTYIFAVEVSILTLPRSEVLRVVQIEPIESSSAGLPPPAALQHRRAVQRGSIVVSVINQPLIRFACTYLLSIYLDQNKCVR